jgi:hypothetical protein
MVDALTRSTGLKSYQCIRSCVRAGEEGSIEVRGSTLGVGGFDEVGRIEEVGLVNRGFEEENVYEGACEDSRFPPA